MSALYKNNFVMKVCWDGGLCGMGIVEDQLQDPIDFVAEHIFVMKVFL